MVLAEVTANSGARIGNQRSGMGSGLQVRRAAKREFTPKRQERFFERLTETSNIRAAAAHAGVSEQTIWRWRNKDEVFARRWAMALEQGYADLEMRLLAQARFGVEAEEICEPTASGGQLKKLRRDTPSHGRFMLQLRQRTGTAGGMVEVGDGQGSVPVAEPFDMLIARLRAKLEDMHVEGVVTIAALSAPQALTAP